MSAESSTLDNFKNPAKKSGQAKIDYRDAIPRADLPASGFATTIVEAAVASGASGIRAAQRIALKHARAALEEAADHWTRPTEYLRQRLEGSEPNQRAGARLARRWRPRFLAALSITHSPTLSARHAKISLPCVYLHRKDDKEFAAQWDEAQEAALDLLHARVWQRSLEGDVEPVFFMGVPVGYVRKFSDKLQIELLRAWRPDRFKTAGVAVNIAARGDVFLLTEDQRHELRALNRAWLMDESTRGAAAAGGGGEAAGAAAGAQRVEALPFGGGEAAAGGGEG